MYPSTPFLPGAHVPGTLKRAVPMRPSDDECSLRRTDPARHGRQTGHGVCMRLTDGVRADAGRAGIIGRARWWEDAPGVALVLCNQQMDAVYRLP
jgi:hypothetical protein